MTKHDEDELLSKIREVKTRCGISDNGSGSDNSALDGKGGINIAFRMGADLAAGLIVGVASGYFIDKYLDTKPIFLIICMFFGLAGGFLNMYRANKKLISDIEKNDNRKNNCKK